MTIFHDISWNLCIAHIFKELSDLGHPKSGFQTKWSQMIYRCLNSNNRIRCKQGIEKFSYVQGTPNACVYLSITAGLMELKLAQKCRLRLRLPSKRNSIKIRDVGYQFPTLLCGFVMECLLTLFAGISRLFVSDSSNLTANPHPLSYTLV